MNQFSLTYPSEIQSESKLIEDVTWILIKEGITTDKIKKVLLVLTEIINNAIIHGNNSDVNKKVGLILTVKPGEVQADILDEGKNGPQQIKIRPLPSPEAIGGRGIDLIEFYAESVTYSELEHGGLKVSVVIKLENDKKEITQ